MRNRIIKFSEKQIEQIFILYESGLYSSRELSKLTNISKTWIHKLIKERYNKFNSKSAETRFWEKVMPEPNTGCWLWIGARSNTKYGQFFDGEKDLKAHQFAWNFYKGKVPKGKIICHKCDVRFCVNPDHLFLGTHKENTDDARKKGRLDKSRISVTCPNCYTNFITSGLVQ